jgi:hypothetical protein
MQRSSETIGTIAAALAKAQAELINPEKSLVAIIRADVPGGTAERSFRYAPLSSGLEIVRKTLSQQEIATVQTTAVDQAAGIITLTTVLAHASGEWIASDWPVCATSETATPHRMGAALTYTRRYALFTLVGIAGEDDIDALDLNASPSAAGAMLGEPRVKKGQPNGGLAQSSPRPTALNGAADRRQPYAGATPPPVMLDPDASGALRDRLVAELQTIESAEEAAIWAHRVLGSKGTLVAADALHVEDCFQRKLTQFESMGALGQRRRTRARKSNRPTQIEKNELTHPEPRRLRDREHMRFLTKQPCLICGRTPSDPHHLRFSQPRALSRKASDEFTVPLCRGHHREVHRSGDEAKWWNAVGIDPMAPARLFWLKTHPIPSRPGIVTTQDGPPADVVSYDETKPIAAAGA